MLILHAGFDGAHIMLWAEQPQPAGAKPVESIKLTPRTGKEHSPPIRSPYDAEGKALRKLIAQASFAAEKSLPPAEPLLAWLPTTKSGPIASSAMIDEQPSSGAKIVILPWSVTGLRMEPKHALPLLSWCLKGEALGAGVIAGPSLSFWARALSFVGELITQEQFLPIVAYEAGTWFARWLPGHNHATTVRLQQLADCMPGACRAITADAERIAPTTPAQTRLEQFVSLYCDYLVRWANNPYRTAPAATQALQTARRNFDSLHEHWLFALCSTTGEMAADGPELSRFASQLKEWRAPLRTSLDAPFKLCFKLNDPGEPPDEPENADPVWSVEYLLQAHHDPSLLIPAEKAWVPTSDSEQYLIRPNFNPREYLLSSLGTAARFSSDVDLSLRDSAPGGFLCGTEAAYNFLSETSWMLEQAGFGVLLPSWWSRKGTKMRLSASASVKSPAMAAAAGLSMQTLVDIDWVVMLGDQELTLEELEDLARQKGSLVKMRGQWVQLDAAEIAAAIKFWKERRSQKTSVRDVVRAALGASDPPGGLASTRGVKASGWVGDMLNQLTGRAATDAANIGLPVRFTGVLRPYQHRGFSWMEFLRQWGLGACLADDMGLGKTCTTLALIQRQHESGVTGPTLIVCPTSVIGNWQKEAQKFTPDLKVVVHHGTGRSKGEAFARSIEGCAVVLSSYALLNRDFEILKEIEWAAVILDEAQNIKNPETRQARAARNLKAGFRAALTGTPVENHIGDLWSLMEFINPGFLGSRAAFRRNFFTPIQVHGDIEATERLKRLTSPFLLRRLKTDKSIIDDLPEKQEMKVYCTLTREQASLYRAVVKELEEAIDGSEGIQRSGMVLAALSKIKQICNHPAQFLKDNTSLPDRSGKLVRLTEMLDEALAAGDRALLFTQFAEMGEMLKKHLQETFGREVLFLHGGTSKKQRDAMVERFQSEKGGPAIFILSLKAGGTGLNLTAANHVFHFDRWWNPAVENQATDRAFRIGQKRNVQVHKFLCVGTLEERIDAMIESKHALAGKVVGTGEEWITKLTNNDLKELFALRADAVSD